MNSAPNSKPDHKEKIEHVFTKNDHGCLFVHRVPDPKPTMLEMPAGVYTIHLDPENGPHFHQAEQIKPPKKIYGDLVNNTARYFRSFEKGSGNMGVALLGEKGSGKTTDLLLMTEQAIKLQMPVILIDQFIPANLLAHLFARIKQDILVIIDEFDKKYGTPTSDDEDDNGDSEQPKQNALLTLLDGSSGGGKKLFAIAGNKGEKVSEFLRNRPSRIRYTQVFDVLPLKVVSHYLRDNLQGHDLARSRFYKLVAGCNVKFNFDMMKGLVDEMNEYKEDVFTAASMMFGSLGISKLSNYLVTTKNTDGTEQDRFGTESYNSNGEFYIQVTGRNDPETGSLIPEDMVTLKDTTDLTDFNDDGTMIYVKDEVTYCLYPLPENITMSFANAHNDPERQRILEKVMAISQQRAEASTIFQETQRKKKIEELNLAAIAKGEEPAGEAAVARQERIERGVAGMATMPEFTNTWAQRPGAKIVGGSPTVMVTEVDHSTKRVNGR